jgi:tetratricopeptide (TPR) repeat protein
VTSGRRSALLVATDRYEDEGFTQLRAPAGDAAALAEVLGDPEIGGFEVQPPLLNQPEGVVRREIDGFLDSARLGDTVLLYISGHGVLSQNGQLFFAMVDTLLGRLRSTAVPGSFVHDVMTHSRAHRKVLILDCCHSGAFTRGMSPKSDRQVHVGDRFQGRGHVTLTASDELEYALEEDHVESLGGAQANSLFTRLLVEGLRSGEADVNGDGLVSVDELYEYVFDHMRGRTANQTPGIEGVVRGEIIIASARIRARPDPAGEPAAAPPRGRLAPQVANLLRRAEAKRSRDDLESARKDVDEALRLAPDSVEALTARGELRRRLADFEGAREDFAAALALDPDDYAGLVGRGRLADLGDDAAAGLADLGRAIELDPGTADAYLARGFVLAFAVPPRAAEAAADFERVLALEPGQAEAKKGADWLAAAEAQPATALVAFLFALEASMLDPDSPYVRVARASILARHERYAEALTEFDAVLEGLPHNARALAERGALRVRMGEPAAALRDLDAALETDPGNATALLWRGAAKLRRSEPEAALADLDAVAGRDADAAGPPVAALRAEALLALGRPEEALGDLESTPASALDPQMLAIRGEARLKLGRPGEGLADAQHALELHATHDGARALLVRSFLAVAATVPPPRDEAERRARLRRNRRLVGGVELEQTWYDGQKQAILGFLTETEQVLWLCRCRRQGEMFRSVALLVTTEQVAWCKQVAFGSPQPGSIAIADIKKVDRVDGGFKLRAAGKVEAAFTGFTGGGHDLVGPGVSFAADELLALLRALVERRRAAA